MNLYQQYLVADMIQKRLAQIGLASSYTMMMTRDDNPTVSTSIGYYDTEGNYLFDKDREAKANEFLEAFPDATVTRESKYGGAPEIVLSGVTHLGFVWEISFGTGVCEQKQVGTKKVMRYDPEQIKKIPLVEVEEPLYEYLCPDPISTAGLVNA